MNPMSITIGYQLPFRAEAFTTTDPVLRVRVRCKPETRPKALLQIQPHVAVFLDAARFGMGAGARLPPRLDYRSIDDVLRTTTHHPTVVLEAPVVVDPSYVTVLLHKLLGLSEVVLIEEVTVELPGLSPTREPIPIEHGDRSVLPRIHEPLPFAFDDERSGHADGCMVTIRHVQPPDDARLDTLRDGLRVFIAQALQGGFISPPIGPDDYFVSADDDVLVHDDEVTWAMECCDFAPDGLHGLLNFLIAYHRQAAALRQVSIE